MVRAGFGRKLDADDIYEHLTEPEKLLLLQDEGRILAMASYNRKSFGGARGGSLIVEGIAMLPEIQGNGVFSRMTEKVVDDSDNFICLRTQNPRMYQALSKFCMSTYVCRENIAENPNIVGAGRPLDINKIKDGFVKYLGCDVNENGVVKGYYGGLFYGEEPHHEKVDPLFEKLGMDLNNGDAVLLIGKRFPSSGDMLGF